MSTVEAVYRMAVLVLKYGWLTVKFFFMLVYALVKLLRDPKAFDNAETEKSTAAAVPPTQSAVPLETLKVLTGSESRRLTGDNNRDGQAEPASAIQEVFNGDRNDPATVSMHMRLFLGATPRIERTLKVPRSRLHWQRATMAFERVGISPFTPVIASNAGLPFNFEGAYKYSLPEMVKGSKPAPVQPMIQQRPPVSGQFDHGVVSQTVDSAQAANKVNEATGVVVSAGSSTVTPQGRKPYTTFTVVLSAPGGEVSFSGVDLKEKFNNHDFRLQDLVAIKKSQAKFTVDGENGSKERSKNSYEVTVLKRAVF